MSTRTGGWAPLAKAEMEIVLGEVLRQRPDYHIAEEKVQEPDAIGIVYGLGWLPETLTPSPAE